MYIEMLNTKMNKSMYAGAGVALARLPRSNGSKNEWLQGRRGEKGAYFIFVYVVYLVIYDTG